MKNDKNDELALPVNLGLGACCENPFSDEERTKLVNLCKALGNPLRFAIVEYLATHPGCITGDIVKVLPVAQSTTSQHLLVLKEAGFIKGSIEGTATCYCLDPQVMAWFRDATGRLWADTTVSACK